MSRHVNIPVFIPHLGCPNDCVFCNQRVISGTERFDPEAVRGIIDGVLDTVGNADCEIAFFGGSFTGIDRGLMTYLLDIAEEYVKDGKATGIRCSTRPDYIDDAVLDILSRYTVNAVELGIQSMSARVLAASRRGHTPDDSMRACRMLAERGYAVGGQMMVGLPLSTQEDESECAEAICRAGCREARIYPTVVFADTELHFMMKRGEYVPLTAEDAVNRTAPLLEIFHKHGVKVLRVGLCESENLHSSRYAAGPNHPALGELCESAVFYNRITDENNCEKLAGNVTVYVPRGAVSKAVGHKRQNSEKIKKIYGLRTLRFKESDELSGYCVRVETDGIK